MMRYSGSDKGARPGGRRRGSRAAVACAALLAAVSIIAGCGNDEAGQSSAENPASGTTPQEESTTSPSTTATAGDYRGPNTRSVRVTEAVDGDTVVIEPAIEGSNVLELLGVDTPELDPEEPLAEEAAEFTEQELETEKVSLIVADEPVDPYGRVLGTIMPAGQQATHGQRLLREGYAQTLFYEPNTQYEMLYLSTQEDAADREVGMWGMPLQQRCQLANHGNGIGSSSPQCED